MRAISSSEVILNVFLMKGCSVQDEVLDQAGLILIQQGKLLAGQAGQHPSLGIKDADGNLDEVGSDMKGRRGLRPKK